MKQKNVILMSSPIVSEVANLHKKRLKIPQIDKKGVFAEHPGISDVSLKNSGCAVCGDVVNTGTFLGTSIGDNCR